MGITKNDCTLLFHAKNLGVDYKNTLMLGRLRLYTSKENVSTIINKFQNVRKGMSDVSFPDDYSEPLFEILGTENIKSIDYSNYENASIIHDMNQPMPVQYNNLFTCVVDSGTIEHIFNFPVAIKNCMEALVVGGHYIGISPANNQMGHGFYQFSPELYYRVFSEENGFRIVSMLITVDSETDTQWYEVADPKSVKSRVTLVNNFPLSLRFVAQKISQKEIFKNPPQQSDYTTTWNAFKSVHENIAEPGSSKIQSLYKKMLPYRLKVILRNIYNIYKVEKVESPTLGVINPEHFRKVEI